MNTLRVGTWNIAAARRLRSEVQLDYGAEDIGYIADQIRRARLDVVCLQESHIKPDDSLARRIASLVDMPHVAETPGCPSHINPAYRMCDAVLSRRPFTKRPTSWLLPRPGFELRFGDSGKLAQPFDRHLLSTHIAGVQVATLHTEPLERFGHSYQHGPGAVHSHDIDAALGQHLASPVIIAGDFNTDSPAAALFKDTRAALSLEEVFTANEATTPWQTRPDHIFYSPGLRTVESGIAQTQTDHFLLWAEVQYT